MLISARTAAGYFAGHTEILHIFTYIAESALFLFNHFNFRLPYVTTKRCQLLEICILDSLINAQAISVPEFTDTSTAAHGGHTNK